MMRGERRGRVNGWDKPFGAIPALALSSQVASLLIFATLCVVVLGTGAGKNEEDVWVPVTYFPLIVMVMANWLYCQVADPSQPGGIPVSCMRESQGTARYCSECKKTIPGLDHHCKWLNTCVGTKTYFQFYLLSLFGWLAFGFQLVVGIYFLAVGGIRETVEGNIGSAPFYTVSALNLFFSVILFMSYVTLWMYHTFLMYKGQGTYMYMIEQHKKSMEKRKQQKIAATSGEIKKDTNNV